MTLKKNKKKIKKSHSNHVVKGEKKYVDLEIISINDIIATS
jgi:hypothetical protein